MTELGIKSIKVILICIAIIFLVCLILVLSIRIKELEKNMTILYDINDISLEIHKKNGEFRKTSSKNFELIYCKMDAMEDRLNLLESQCEKCNENKKEVL